MSVGGFASQDSWELSGLCNPAFSLLPDLTGVVLTLHCCSLERDGVEFHLRQDRCGVAAHREVCGSQCGYLKLAAGVPESQVLHSLCGWGQGSGLPTSSIVTS